MHRRSTSRAGRLVLLGIIGVAFAIPLAWMVVVAARPHDAAHTGAGITALLDNIRSVWEWPGADFPIYFRNSTLVSLFAVAGMTLSSAVCAYGFSRLRWPGRDSLFMVVLATLMIPPVVVMAPLYVVFKKLGWIGTLLPLWAPSCFAGAMSIFLLRQFFRTIPRELDEAARIDGCSHWGIFTRVIIPSSTPAIATVALLHFIATWNDFLTPLLFINHQDQYTLPLGLHMFNQQHGQTPWPLVMAACCITVAPVMLVYVLARRWFTQGVAATGLKE